MTKAELTWVLLYPWPLTHSQPLLRNHCSRSWIPSRKARTHTAACIAENLDKEGFVHIFCFLEAAEFCKLWHAEFSYLVMLIIHQHWFHQFWSLIFYILSKCKKNRYIKGTESITLWQRLARAYIMPQGLEFPCCSGKQKHSLGTSPSKGKTSPLLLPQSICYSSSLYFRTSFSAVLPQILLYSHLSATMQSFLKMAKPDTL